MHRGYWQIRVSEELVGSTDLSLLSDENCQRVSKTQLPRTMCSIGRSKDLVRVT